jgi:hypothetical protein
MGLSIAILPVITRPMHQLLNARLIEDLRKRTLAEYSVAMTIYGVGAFIAAMLVAAFLEHWLSGYALFAVAALFWLLAIAYLWCHFRWASRGAQLAPSSTWLFHKIQFVAFGLALLPMLYWRGSGVAALLFSTISLGVEAALTAFFVCHIFLATTLRQRTPRAAFLGILFSSVGFYFSYRQVLTESGTH